MSKWRNLLWFEASRRAHDGVWNKNKKKPVAKQIADRLGVSTTTITRILNLERNTVGEGRRKKSSAEDYDPDYDTKMKFSRWLNIDIADLEDAIESAPYAPAPPRRAKTRNPPPT